MRIHIPALLAAALLVPGCGGGSATSNQPESFATPREDRVFLEIDNQNFDRATIWYTSTGSRRRVGVVEGKNKETFTIQNWRVSAPMVVEIQLTAGSRCVTRELLTDPGDSLYLVIPVAGLSGGC